MLKAFNIPPPKSERIRSQLTTFRQRETPLHITIKLDPAISLNKRSILPQGKEMNEEKEEENPHFLRSYSI